eukprot:TRINITY_DN4368_c1_g1_i13.p1 TRINITY_DN4368_c1_g1~~TRINITY_DN4368_c1_g1_i13.p1  ORF type:complete len:148 (-),score=7.42 TRINITY_DN4368_c1_g1_i13:519-962(-)
MICNIQNLICMIYFLDFCSKNKIVQIQALNEQKVGNVDLSAQNDFFQTKYFVSYYFVYFFGQIAEKIVKFLGWFLRTRNVLKIYPNSILILLILFLQLQLDSYSLLPSMTNIFSSSAQLLNLIYNLRNLFACTRVDQILVGSVSHPH